MSWYSTSQMVCADVAARTHEQD